jgi:hypothetical protein
MVNAGGTISRTILKAWFYVIESKFLFDDLFEFPLILVCCLIISHDGFYFIILAIGNGGNWGV